MTNFQIITNAAIANGLYTKEQAEAIIAERGELPLHTFPEWKRLGFSVKKGEHAKLTCDIWKMRDKKGAHQANGEEQEVDENHFFKHKAFFFLPEQVEKIKEKEG